MHKSSYRVRSSRGLFSGLLLALVASACAGRPSPVDGSAPSSRIVPEEPTCHGLQPAPPPVAPQPRETFFIGQFPRQAASPGGETFVVRTSAEFATNVPEATFVYDLSLAHVAAFVVPAGMLLATVTSDGTTAEATVGSACEGGPPAATEPTIALYRVAQSVAGAKITRTAPPKNCVPVAAEPPFVAPIPPTPVALLADTSKTKHEPTILRSEAAYKSAYPAASKAHPFDFSASNLLVVHAADQWTVEKLTVGPEAASVMLAHQCRGKKEPFDPGIDGARVFLFSLPKTIKTADQALAPFSCLSDR